MSFPSGLWNATPTVSGETTTWDDMFPGAGGFTPSGPLPEQALQQTPVGLPPPPLSPAPSVPSQSPSGSARRAHSVPAGMGGGGGDGPPPTPPRSGPGVGAGPETPRVVRDARAPASQASDGRHSVPESEEPPEEAVAATAGMWQQGMHPIRLNFGTLSEKADRYKGWRHHAINEIIGIDHVDGAVI